MFAEPGDRLQFRGVERTLLPPLRFPSLQRSAPRITTLLGNYHVEGLASLLQPRETFFLDVKSIYFRDIPSTS